MMGIPTKILAAYRMTIAIGVLFKTRDVTIPDFKSSRYLQTIELV